MNPFIDRCHWWCDIKSLLRFPFCNCYYDCAWKLPKEKWEGSKGFNGVVIEGGCKYHD